MNKIIGKAKEISKKYKLFALKEVLIFCVITIVVHYLYRYWAIDLHYKPFSSFVWDVQKFIADGVINNSTWFLEDILNVSATVIDEKIYMANNGWVGVGPGCSAFKPMIQFLILMLIFPGPWKKKLWFIPAGIIVIHITNVFRIVTLSLITHNSCSQKFWDFSHDYLLRPLFYAVIFTMWVIWVEILSKKSNKEQHLS